MKFGRIVNVALLSALAFGAAAYGSVQASAATPSGAPIVLGSVGAYSTTTGNIADPGRPAIEAWASWVNAHGGINGHPVKLIVKDNMNDEAQAVSEVKQLVQQDHVIAFVSNQDGSLNSGYAAYLQQQQIPVLGGNVYTLEPWDSNPMFFPEGMTALPQLSAIVQSAQKSGHSKIGSLACSESAAVCRGKLLPEVAGGQGWAPGRLRRLGQLDGTRLHRELPGGPAGRSTGTRPPRSDGGRRPDHRRRLCSSELQARLHHSVERPSVPAI